ncbi:MAG: adenine phosphoribosyltransferase [Treponema sp.]|jgi:adenine phosphoribosyltransferase|nr:adenine phosphoribosyltransferase [Treponema sp.]MBQ1590762.1 adenine phosphoribosyltransferase [Treponema sp.]MBQ1726361.1 adenine phosphoribosyltransferase [Treponema sp.]MBQ2206518.1 adenine phosphoribosyltransferase [Treponema sp.]MBQ2357094.1 adenine phosphoribosyltransferase [Treponema sp.]
MAQNKDFEVLDKVIGRIPDFPKPGVLFYDITGILRHPEAFNYCIDRMVEIYKDEKIDAVAAIESRGFIFASPFAIRMGIPLVLIRKKGKLPGKTFSCKYSLEYGTAEIEAHVADITKDKRILLVDDLIATGGTLAAARNLVEQGGASVAGVFGVIGLPFLNYDRVLSPVKATTLVNYNSESM